MSVYSYSEIQTMQQKAMERVKEMKRKSDIITQTAQRDLGVTSEKQNYNNSQEMSPKVTNMPPNFPENNPYPSFKDFFKAEGEKAKQPIHSQVKNGKPQKQGLESLFDEPDKALILGLIMLLKSEGADESLIMALSYILT